MSSAFDPSTSTPSLLTAAARPPNRPPKKGSHRTRTVIRTTFRPLHPAASLARDPWSPGDAQRPRGCDRAQVSTAAVYPPLERGALAHRRVSNPDPDLAGGPHYVCPEAAPITCRSMTTLSRERLHGSAAHRWRRSEP